MATNTLTLKVDTRAAKMVVSAFAFLVGIGWRPSERMVDRLTNFAIGLVRVEV